MIATSYRPPRAVLTQRDARAGLAIEDRDLRSEARDLDGCAGAALEVLLTLYPPIVLGGNRYPVMGN